MRFNLIHRTWAFHIVHVVGPWGEQAGFWAGARGSGVSLDLPFPWAWRVGLHAYFFKPYQKQIIMFQNLITNPIIV